MLQVRFEDCGTYSKTDHRGTRILLVWFPYPGMFIDVDPGFKGVVRFVASVRLDLGGLASDAGLAHTQWDIQ